MPMEERLGGSLDPFVISWKQQSHSCADAPAEYLEILGELPEPFPHAFTDGVGNTALA